MSERLMMVMARIVINNVNDNAFLNGPEPKTMQI